MHEKDLARIIKDLEIIQILLMQQRRDHNGQVLEHDDLDVIQLTIEILSNLIMDDQYIWRKK